MSCVTFRSMLPAGKSQPAEGGFLLKKGVTPTVGTTRIIGLGFRLAVDNYNAGVTNVTKDAGTQKQTKKPRTHDASDRGPILRGDAK